MNKLRSLRYRLLALAALLVCLTVLLAPVSRTQSTTCCNACLKRFQQCDANSIVCCQIYDSCVQQCPSACLSCPDAKKR